ncbi:hypothetical protein QQZ08_010502 [Neonectria magnoliae]|uniref:Zn(2)-C6 fungal-type domain-containing protein n=1 Tax=Neonectria magnoliae TaxID=2732573 RepID=A0ABR1HHJ2_9HYPO
MVSSAPLQRILPRPAAEVEPETQEQPPPLLPKPKERSHTAIACLRCRARKSKCKGQQPTCISCEVVGAVCIYSAPENPANAIIRELEGQYNEASTILNTLHQQDLSTAIQMLLRIRAAEGPEILAALNREAAQEAPRLAGLPQPFPLMQGTEPVPGDDSEGVYRVHAVRRSSELLLEELPLAQWTRVPLDEGTLNHLLALFWTWDISLARIIDRDLFLEHLRTRGNPMPNIRATIPGGFCSEALVNAMLAIATMYYGDSTSTEDSVRAHGRVFADESFRLLAVQDQPSSIPLLQAIAFVWVYEEATGNWKRASELLEHLFYIHATSTFFSTTPVPQTTEGVTVDERVQHALASMAWGFYSLDAKIHILLGSPMWTKKPVLPKPYQGNASPYHGMVNSTWRPYPGLNQGQPSHQKESMLAECEFAEFSDRVLYYAEDDRVSIVPDIGRCKALYNELLHRKSALHEQFGNERGLIPPKMVLQLFYDMLAIKLLEPCARFSFVEPDGGQTALCLTFQHCESMVSNMWNYRAGFGMRLGYWMLQACRNIVVTLLPRLSTSFSQGETYRKACELMYEMKPYMPLAGETLAILNDTMDTQSIEVPSGATVFFQD